MKKAIRLFVCMFVLLLALNGPLQSLGVKAAEIELADGEYSLPLKVLNVSSDDASSFNSYFKDQAVLRVKDGKQEILLTQIKGYSVLGDITFDINGTSTKFVQESADEAEQTKVLKVAVPSIQTSYQAEIAVPAAGHSYPVRFVLDLSSLNEGNENKDNNENTPPVQNEDPTKVDPEQKDPNTGLKDGEYSLPLKVLSVSTDDVSAFNSYFKDQAVLRVKDGKQEILLTQINGYSVLGDISFDINGASTKFVQESADEAEQTKVLKVAVPSIQNSYQAEIAVPAAGHSYPVRFVLDLSSLNEGNENKDNNENTPPVQNEDPTKVDSEQKDPNTGLKDGEYSLPLKVLSVSTDDVSAFNSYFADKAVLRVKDGKQEILLTQINGYSVLGDISFNINGKSTKFVQESADEAEQTKALKIAVSMIQSSYQAEIAVPAAGHSYPVRFVFDLTSLNLGNENKDTNEDNNGNTPPVQNEDPTKVDPGQKDPNIGLKDGEYSLPLKVLSVSSDDFSAFDSYFADKAVLRVKDGKQEILLTQIKGYSVLGDISFNINGKSTKFVQESADEAKQTKVLKIAVSMIQNSYQAEIAVPAAGHSYPVRFVFDLTSLNLGNENKDTNEDPTKVDPGQKDIDNPNFDRNADNSVDPTGKNDAVETEKTNPKTADTAQIGLYICLLLGSLLVLIRKYRAKSL